MFVISCLDLLHQGGDDFERVCASCLCQCLLESDVKGVQKHSSQNDDFAHLIVAAACKQGLTCSDTHTTPLLLWHSLLLPTPPCHSVQEFWQTGGRRMLWVSTSRDLAYDARRDLDDVGLGDVPVHPKVCALGLLHMQVEVIELLHDSFSTVQCFFFGRQPTIAWWDSSESFVCTEKMARCMVWGQQTHKDATSPTLMCAEQGQPAQWPTGQALPGGRAVHHVLTADSQGQGEIW